MAASELSAAFGRQPGNGKGWDVHWMFPSIQAFSAYTFVASGRNCYAWTDLSGPGFGLCHAWLRGASAVACRSAAAGVWLTQLHLLHFSIRLSLCDQGVPPLALVACTAGQSGCCANLMAAMQPALGLLPRWITQVGSSYSISRPRGSLGSSQASSQQGSSSLLGPCCPAARISRWKAILPYSCITSSAGLSSFQ